METEKSDEKSKEAFGEGESLKESSKLSQPWKGSDVIFEVEGKEIHANRAILSIWSPVFEAMFNGDYKEEKLEAIPLPEKKYSDVVELFELCHIPMTRVTDENVHAVLPLADEYQMERILKDCESVLLSQEASVRNLFISKRYGFTRLGETCMEFVKKTPMSSMSETDFDNLDPGTRELILKFKVKCLEPLVTLLEELRVIALADKKDCSKCSARNCLACERGLDNRGATLGGSNEDNEWGYSHKRSRTLCQTCTKDILQNIYNKMVPFVPDSLFCSQIVKIDER